MFSKLHKGLGTNNIQERGIQAMIAARAAVKAPPEIVSNLQDLISLLEPGVDVFSGWRGCGPVL